MRMGTSVDFWTNAQAKYDAYKVSLNMENFNNFRRIFRFEHLIFFIF